MNLRWPDLTPHQQEAIALLCKGGPRFLPAELAEQLINLGLIERAGRTYCISSLGTTVNPAALQ